MSRGGFKINTQGQHEVMNVNSNIPSWMNELVSKAEDIVKNEEARQKSAVTVVDKSRAPTVYEQMYSILNGKKPLYSSVEEAVSDYQMKTGLTAHLQKIQAETEGTSKSASLEEIANMIIEASEEEEKKNSEISLFQKYPGLQEAINQTAKNHVNISIPAVLQMLAEQGIDSSDLENAEFLQYVNNVLKEYQKTNNTNYSFIGGIDKLEDNNNVFESIKL